MKDYETKQSKAVRLYCNGNVKDALRIFKTFRMSLSKEEQRLIGIAYECMSGHERFYRQLGLDIESIEENAKCIIENKFCYGN